MMGSRVGIQQGDTYPGIPPCIQQETLRRADTTVIHRRTDSSLRRAGTTTPTDGQHYAQHARHHRRTDSTMRSMPALTDGRTALCAACPLSSMDGHHSAQRCSLSSKDGHHSALRCSLPTTDGHHSAQRCTPYDGRAPLCAEVHPLMLHGGIPWVYTGHAGRRDTLGVYRACREEKPLRRVSLPYRERGRNLCAESLFLSLDQRTVGQHLPFLTFLTLSCGNRPYS